MGKFNKKLSLEQIENDLCSAYQYESNLVEKCHEYRKIPLEMLTAEQIRLLLGQDIGNAYLIPMAIELLGRNILVAGDFYAGDLLMAVLTSKTTFWQNERDLWKEMCNLVKRNTAKIETTDLIYDALKKDIFEACSAFKSIQI